MNFIPELILCGLSALRAARVAELVDAEDLKSFGRKVVRVQVSSWAHFSVEGLDPF